MMMNDSHHFYKFQWSQYQNQVNQMKGQWFFNFAKLPKQQQ